MRSDDHKQSSMREGSQKCAFEDGGDNCHSPRDDTSPSKLTPKDEIAAPSTNIKLYTTTHNRLNNQPKHELQNNVNIVMIIMINIILML